MIELQLAAAWVLIAAIGGWLLRLRRVARWQHRQFFRLAPKVCADLRKLNQQCIELLQLVHPAVIEEFEDYITGESSAPIESHAPSDSAGA